MNRLLTLALATMVLGAVPTIAFGQPDTPDLRGTWQLERIVIGSRRLSDDTAERVLATSTSEVLIDFQEGPRIAGREVSENYDAEAPQSGHRSGERYVGILNTDNSTLYMVDDNGTELCEVISVVRLECMYLHITDQVSAVGRGIWTKQ
jgi:hypothetical protein